MYPKAYFEQHKPQSESGTCFVLMPFAGQYDEVYETIVEAIQGPDLNFVCSRADELFGGGHVLEDILRLIGGAQVVIADVTDRNPNVFYELGIAHMAKDLANVLILTQTLDDVPFDLRHYRCTKYEQSNPGLRQLKRDLIASVKEVAGVAHRFSIMRGNTYQFAESVFGEDRAFYDFEIKQILVSTGAAKFIMAERRHIVGEPVQTIREDSYGIPTGGALPSRVSSRTNFQGTFINSNGLLSLGGQEMRASPVEIPKEKPQTVPSKASYLRNQQACFTRARRRWLKREAFNRTPRLQW